MLPMYKASTQKNHRHISAKHLVPRFGEMRLIGAHAQAIQATSLICAARIRAEDDRPHSRCAERDPPDGGEVGASEENPARGWLCRR